MELYPKSEQKEPILKFDFPGIKIGVAEYNEGPTGCTVFLFEDENTGKINGVSYKTDIRGGATGVIFHDYGFANAFCFAGGSLYGLESAFGVINYIHEKNDYSNHWMKIPDVPTAIIYDFGPRDNSIFPDKALGLCAAKNAQYGQIPIGRQGVGVMATGGKGPNFDMGEFSGQGASFKEIGGTKILVFSVVNSVGALKDKTGKIVKGHLDKNTGKRHEYIDLVQETKIDNNNGNKQNTTLTLVITNQKFGSYELQQTSRQIHSSMSKYIDPFNTLSYGDTLFIASTNSIENPALSPAAFGVHASEVLWDAVLTTVHD